MQDLADDPEGKDGFDTDADLAGQLATSAGRGPRGDMQGGVYGRSRSS